MARLRDPETGCPWDIKQTYATIASHTVEEVYEVVDAIERNDLSDLSEELGDLLFQVSFHSLIAEERGLFTLDDVIESITEKLIRRHPHVFDGTSKPLSAKEQTQAWDEIKAQEKNKKDIHKTFADIPASLPPILKAKKIQKKAAKKGFDWKESIEVIEKVEEELKELKHEIQQNNKENSLEELGDLLFSIINLSRHLEIDASEAINQANHKFVKRFRLMEEEIAKDKKDLDNLSPEELEEFWVKIKSHG